MTGGSQYVPLVRRPVDGQLVSVAGHVWAGAVLKQQLHAVQVPRSGCVVQDRVSVAGLGVHVTAWRGAEGSTSLYNMRIM